MFCLFFAAQTAAENFALELAEARQQAEAERLEQLSRLRDEHASALEAQSTQHRTSLAQAAARHQEAVAAGAETGRAAMEEELSRAEGREAGLKDKLSKQKQAHEVSGPSCCCSCSCCYLSCFAHTALFLLEYKGERHITRVCVIRRH